MRTIYSVEKTDQVVAEAKKYGIKVLGISECRWSGFGRLKTATGETIVYSRRDDIHQSRVTSDTIKQGNGGMPIRMETSV